MEQDVKRNELDILILEKYRHIKELGTQIAAKQHPFIYAFLSALFKNRKGKVGLQIVAEGAILRNYTVFLDGLRIEKIEPDVLEPGIEIPLWGEIKPYTILEKKDLEAMINDPVILQGDIFKNSVKYFPLVTIKFR